MIVFFHSFSVEAVITMQAQPMQMVALFAGNYLANKSKALSPEQLVKILAQSLTVYRVDVFMKTLKVPEYGPVRDYMDTVYLILSVALTSIAYEAIVDAVEGKSIGFSKDELKKGLLQGLVFAAGNMVKLY
jgi:hypothetical protein